MPRVPQNSKRASAGRRGAAGLQQEPPQLLHDAVMQKIRRETRQKKERKPLLRFVGVMAAVAALLAVLAGFHLIRLPGFDSGEASVSMGDTLFPRAQSAKEYAEQLARRPAAA